MEISTLNKKKTALGGARINAGRPRRLDKDDYVQITCMLRRDTVARLRAGAGGGATGTAQRGRFGKFLQHHLDRHPLPSNEEYWAMLNDEPVSMGPSPRMIRKHVNKFLKQQKELEQKKMLARARRMAKRK